MAIAKEQIWQIISENDINSVADVYTLLKDSFKDILHELMEAELDASLGYSKNQKGDLESSNKRNGHSPKKLKSLKGYFRHRGKGNLPLCTRYEHPGYPFVFMDLSTTKYRKTEGY